MEALAGGGREEAGGEEDLLFQDDVFKHPDCTNSFADFKE
jgi:hypothetical protein